MTEYPLNPWLQDVVEQFRKSHSQSYLRDWYNSYCIKGGNLSWREFILEHCLEAQLKEKPLLSKPLALLPLSDRSQEILYWSGVDKVYDLLQITKEELDAICINDGTAKNDITRYLKRIRREPRSCPGRTSKLSLSNGYWTIPSPGAFHRFNISRPTLRDEWFEEYYRFHGHFEDDELNRQVFETVRPNSLEGVMMPIDYQEFFQAAKNLFDSYAECCEFCHIKPRVPRPEMPALDVRYIYREALKAVIDVLERTSLLKTAKVGDYLGSPPDERRLNIAEDEGHNQSFQLFLISQVELKIDIENICLTLNECLRGQHRTAYFVRQRPEKHPFSDAILRLREKESDESLRARYSKELEENPNLSWEEFIVQTALAEP